MSVDTYTTRGKIRAILFHKHVYGNAPPPRYQGRVADFVYSPIYGDYYGIESTSKKKTIPIIELVHRRPSEFYHSSGAEIWGPSSSVLIEIWRRFSEHDMLIENYGLCLEYIHGSNAKCGSHAGGCNNNKKKYTLRI